MKWSVIGLFGRVMNNNVELCSDWLFHGAAHFSRSHSYFQYFLSQFFRQVIILYINCGHQGATINMRGTETAIKCMVAFYFHFHYQDWRLHELCLYYGMAVLTTPFTRSDVNGAQDL